MIERAGKAVTVLACALLSLLALLTDASAATDVHLIEKISAIPVRLPSDYKEGDTLEIIGSALEPSDWQILAESGRRPLFRLILNGATKEIPDFALKNCDRIQSLIGMKVESVGMQAFQSCDSLRFVVLPTALEIGVGAFADCQRLENVFLPEARSIGVGAFFTCSSLRFAALPKVLAVGDSAFAKCLSLETILLPEALGIGRAAFDGNKSLRSVSLPKAERIGMDAYFGCTALTAVSLPQAASIGNYAFALANSGGVLRFLELGQNAPSLDDQVFDKRNTPILLLVPRENADEYLSHAAWQKLPKGSAAQGIGRRTQGPVVLEPGSELNLDSGLNGISDSLSWQQDGSTVENNNTVYSLSRASSSDAGVYTARFDYGDFVNLSLPEVRVVVGSPAAIDGAAAKTGRQNATPGKPVTPVNLPVSGEDTPEVITFGRPPQGVDFLYDKERGLIRISGTPTETGTFPLGAYAFNDASLYEGHPATLEYVIMVTNP